MYVLEVKLHTSRSKPDWQYEKKADLTRWQSLALASRGIITPGNFISVGGLLLVLYGAHQIYVGETMVGLLYIIGGRLMDLIDGFVAEYTKTKSQLGEIVDTTCDKISIITAVIAAYVAGLLPGALVTILFLHHTYTALFSVLFARRYNLHTRRIGKYAMFVSWLTIIVVIYASTIENAVLNIVTWALIVIYACFAIAAVFDYYFALQRKIVDRMRVANWTKNVRTIVYVYNRKASNFNRADRWVKRITKYLNQPQIDIPSAKAEERLLSTIKEQYTEGHSTVVAVAGGDGTVSMIANILLASEDQDLLKNVYFLPLWGGNANDFGTMLNGLVSQSTPRRLLSQSSIAIIPTIEVTMKNAKESQTIFACGYASFGASAFAARKLNQKRLSDNRLIKYFPVIFLLRELMAVLTAFSQAPMTRTKFGSNDTELYEHTFINGSRIAKVNRVPISLHEPAFFHATVDRKHPSYFVELLRIITKRTRKQYIKRKAVSFTIKDAIDAQIDGEVYAIEPNTHITVRTSRLKLRCISTKFEA